MIRSWDMSRCVYTANVWRWAVVEHCGMCYTQFVPWLDQLLSFSRSLCVSVGQLDSTKSPPGQRYHTILCSWFLYIALCELCCRTRAPNLILWLIMVHSSVVQSSTHHNIIATAEQHNNYYRNQRFLLANTYYTPSMDNYFHTTN